MTTWKRFWIPLAGLLAIALGHPAAQTEITAPTTPGALTVTGPGGELVEMPLQHTDVQVEISAFVARIVVEQTFRNPFDEPVEAVYTFPLGHTAAVDDYELVVGDRTIRGEIHRREEARQIYEKARQAGHRPALLEQERPNIFTQSVANLEPGREILVRIRLVEMLSYEAGVYQFTFPLVVGPRYIPGGAGSTAVERGTGFATGSLPPTPDVPDADRITPPVLAPGFRSGHDVSIQVTLDAGVPIAGLGSPSHRILKDHDGDSSARVTLAADDTIPNRDFTLRWIVSSDEPAVALLAHRSAVDGFFTLLVQPRGEVSAAEATPKEIVLVLDTSGSMSGVPLEASKRFVRKALRTLGPRDTFNVIRFAGSAETFAAAPLPGDAASVDRALAWIEKLRGGGGTELLKGFRRALALEPDPHRMRLVVFLTDGYIGNEHQILSAIDEVVGEARIYTLGVGTSPNHYLLDSMARVGRGAYVATRPDGGEMEVVDKFRGWVTRPYLTDLEVDWGSLSVLDVIPRRPGDLFSGQTLKLVGRYIGAGDGEIVVRGKLAGRYWEQRVPVRLPDRRAAHGSLASVWARQHMEQILLSSPGRPTPAIEAEVTTLALEYRLMSPYTSFVAVDDSEVANPGGEPTTVHQPLPMPESVSFEGVFGDAGAQVVGKASRLMPPPSRPAPGIRPAAEPVRFDAERLSDKVELDEAEASKVVPGLSEQARLYDAHLLEVALRLLADLAEDGRFSPAEGSVSIAGLLAAQNERGRICASLQAQAVATWALAEAASVLPGDPRVEQAAAAARRYLLDREGAEGWPRHEGGPPDAETTAWCRQVLRWTDPDRPAVSRDLTGPFERLRRVVAAASPSARAGTDRLGPPLERLVAAAPGGHLRLASRRQP